MSDQRSRDEVIVSEHLSELRGKVRMLTWISGLSWTILILFGGLLVTGFFDWMIHFDDPGLRLVISVALLIAVSVMAWRQLIRPLIQPLSTTFLALRIEKRFPGLHSRVLSAVEFLQHRLDARVGSPELQQAVVRDALRDLEKIEASDIVETRGVKRITIAGAILCAMIATVVLLHPVEAATSVKRLMFPFADCPWPRKFELKLVRPDLTPVIQAPDQPIFIARGDTLELYVIGSRGRLPSRVWFEHRLEGEQKVQKEPLRQTTLRDEKGRSYEAAVISWVATRGPLQFRATGGDDETMSFVRVEVVQPATLESLRVTVVPPAYSGRPAEVLPQGVGHVQGLLGTTVKIEASADKPIKSARLRVADKPPKNLEIGEDQQQFTASFTITDPGVTGYWFELTDEAGFSDPEAPRFELRGMADTVPDVVIEQPMADVLLAPDAELPIKILAKDDLGLKSVRISYTLNDDPTPKLIPLVSADEKAEPLVLSTPEHVWRLAELSLEPGNRITFRAEATDNYDLGPEPHVGKSAPRTISIVSKDEKQKELAGRVGDLLEDLQQATTLQERARQQTTELQTQLNTTGELRTQDLDQLHRIELDQRQAASRLNRPADGVQSQAQQLQEEFRANKLDDPETEQRLTRIIDELSRLGREQFPEIESALTRAAKQAEDQSRSTPSAESDNSKPIPGTKPEPGKKPDSSPVGSDPVPQEPKTSKNADKTTESNPSKTGTDKPDSSKPDATKPDPSKPSAEQEKPKPEVGSNPPGEKEPPKGASRSPLDSALSEAQTRQSHALEKLQELQGLLSEWRDQRDVSRELNSLIAEQEAIQKDSTELGAQTLSKSAAELSPQQRADLAKMATRQLKNAERVEQFRKQLQQAAEALQQRDPDSADRFKEAQDELNNDGTSGKLREAAQEITDNQIGAAAQMQKQALDDLRDLDKQLKREPTDDTETLVKQIDQVQQEFEGLRKEQEELKKKADQISGQPNSPEKTEQLQQLQQKQKELSEKIDQAERRLERLRLRSPTEAAERAQERLDRIQEQLQDPNQIDDAGEQMQQVLDDLEQVQRDLALEKRVAMERLAVEELEKIQDQLQALLNQQQGVITETERLSVELAQRGSLTRAQLKTLRDLSEVERGLQADAEQMEKSLKVAEVFSLVLRRLSRSLKMSADRLSEKKVDAAALSLQRDAVKKIESLLAVLKPDEQKPQANGQQAPPPPGQGQNPDEQQKPEQGQPPGESLPQLAQLKLLKSLQEEFLERTQLLDSLKDKDGKLPESATVELEELAREQSELADLTRDVIAKMLQSEPDRDDSKAKSPKENSDKNKPQADPDKEKPVEPETNPKPKKKKSDLDPLDLDNFEPDKRPEKNSTGKKPEVKEE